ncbi:hypothetical protein ABPG75_010834 [Micractinium tetrahymenae]
MASGQQADTNAAAAVLSHAAAASLRARQVRLEHFDERPELVISCLAVLPPGLKHLELATRAAGPLPAALQRFPALRSLAITGDGSELDWTSEGCRPAAPAVAAKLTRLRMVFSHPDPDDLDCDDFMVASPVPDELCRLLAGSAARLHTLDVEAVWSPALAELCRSLPALRTLRLGLLHALVPATGRLWADWGKGSPPRPDPTVPHQAAALLRELSPRQRRHVGRGQAFTAEALFEGNIDEEERLRPDMRLPLLAGIPNLHGLEVRQSMLPPADWQQLTSLRRLELRCNGLVSPEDLCFGDSLSQLTALTHLHLGYGALAGRDALPPAVCTLPVLRSLCLEGKPWWGGEEDELRLRLPPSFTQLTSLRQLRVHSMHPMPEGTKQLLKAMPQVKVKETGPWKTFHHSL